MLSSSSLHGRLKIHLLVIDGDCKVMDGEWFDIEWM